MLFEPVMTISDIVQSDYRTAEVFKKHNINYCCSGKISLDDACKLKNIETETILSEIEDATRNICIPNSVDINAWNINFIIDFLINVHHNYLKQNLPMLEVRLVSFEAGHAKKYPEITEILHLFLQLQNMLVSHMTHEEEIIFPYIKQIYSAHTRKEGYANLFVKTLRKPLNNIKYQHDKINELLQQMRELTNYYTFPQKACTNHQVLYHKLHELHKDLVQHKYLENKFLFPKANEIELDLLQL